MAKQLILEPAGWPCSLRECPPGLFLFENSIYFKTEYEKMETIGPVDVPGNEIRWVHGKYTDAYNYAGEHFCHGTPEEREHIMVQPLSWGWTE